MQTSGISTPGRPRRISLADEVYDHLLERLFTEKLEPGTALNIDALARDLDVSQSPIREALARLEATGLVTRAALRGYHAAPLLSPKGIDDLMLARQIIEPALARLAASRVTDEFLQALDDTISHLSSSPEGTSFAEYRAHWKADEDFHDLIARQADNPFLYRAFDSLGGQAQRFRMFGALGVRDAELAIREHKAIQAALVSEDETAAEATMHRHISNVRFRSMQDTSMQL